MKNDLNFTTLTSVCFLLVTLTEGRLEVIMVEHIRGRRLYGGSLVTESVLMWTIAEEQCCYFTQNGVVR